MGTGRQAHRAHQVSQFRHLGPRFSVRLVRPVKREP